jgi:hypothetical protein
MEMIERSRPWYKEFWPWFLIAFPAVAVAAGLVTLRLAVDSSDGLVDDDYYTQGLAINRTLTREHAAASAHLAGRVHFANGAVLLQLSGGLAAWPEELRLRVLHPTRAGMDQMVDLRRQADGSYVGRFKEPALGKWDLILEDREKTWRLMGTWFAQRPEADLTALKN